MVDARGLYHPHFVCLYGTVHHPAYKGFVGYLGPQHGSICHCARCTLLGDLSTDGTCADLTALYSALRLAVA